MPGRWGRTFAVALGAVLLLQSAWAMAMPLFRGPDEIDHTYRAVSIVEGHLFAERVGPDGALATRVPGDIAEASRETCVELYDELRPTACEPMTTYGDGSVGLHSSADHYNPAWYAVVGLPSLVLDGEPAAWAMRGLSALLCAVLVAAALAITSLTSRTGWPVAGLAVVATPAVVFASVVVAPNSVQFAGGLLLWSGLLAVLRTDEHDLPSIVAITSSAGLVVLTHTMGPMWVATIVFAWLFLAGLRRARDVILRNARLWRVSIVTVGALSVASVAWTLSQRTNDPGGAAEVLLDEVKEIPLGVHALLWLFQTVGVMPNRFGVLWPVIYALWLIVILAALVVGVRLGDARIRRCMAVTMAISIAVPAVLTWLTYDALGVAWQGRYGLPLLFGVTLVAVEALERRGVPVRAPAVISSIVVLAGAHYAAVLCVGLREMRGPYDDGRPWLPLLQAVTPAAVLLGYAVWVAMALRPVHVVRSVERE